MKKVLSAVIVAIVMVATVGTSNVSAAHEHQHDGHVAHHHHVHNGHVVHHGH